MAQAFGEVLASPRLHGNSAAVRAAWECVNAYAAVAAADNPRFDYQRFVQAVRDHRDAFTEAALNTRDERDDDDDDTCPDCGGDGIIPAIGDAARFGGTVPCETCEQTGSVAS
jgi:DnaJ-class molecular chaperone